MRLPASTYRIQLGADFPLERARSLVDYLASLGVDLVYLSPLLAARKDSAHGYDVVDAGRIDPKLGSRRDLDELSRELAERGMGVLLDIVPNHMAADADNPWWFDVLSRGRASAYADYFDIDWSAGDADLENRVLLPVLGEDVDAVVRRGELRPVREGGSLVLEYFDRRLPLSAESWPVLLVPAQGRARSNALANINERCRALAGLGVAGRRRESDALHLQLDALLHSDDGLRDAVDAELAATTSERIAALLAEQHYRLRPWRGPLPLNYRRFFDVSGLVGLRVEDPRVFGDSHALVLELVSAGLVQGLRVDHPDGLLDPEGYLGRLAASAPDAFVVVEKILTGDESLRGWPVAGTTGYEQLRVLGGVLLDPAGRDALLASYARFTGQPADFRDVAYASKRDVLERLLAPELAALVRSLQRLLDVPPDELRDALSAVIACFAVYRSYVRPGAVQVEGEDRLLIEQAVGDARGRGAPTAALDAIRSALLLEPPAARDDASRAACLELLLCIQQLTGPAAAKGVEDTACYRYVPLACLDEVGGEPDRFGVGVEEFHAHSRERAARWPGSLSATSTHDTKRSEDVRTRIGVLSEMPTRWAEAVERWHALAAAHRTSLPGGHAPTPNDEYLLYQTLVGTWPASGLDAAELVAYRSRISAYMVKAAREAKLSTGWVDGNHDYEAAVVRFVERLLDREASAELLDDVRALRRAGGARGLAGIAVDAGAQARRTGRAGFLPGQRALGLEPRRSRQPPRGGLRAAARAARRALRPVQRGIAARRPRRRPLEAARHRARPRAPQAPRGAPGGRRLPSGVRCGSAPEPGRRVRPNARQPCRARGCRTLLQSLCRGSAGRRGLGRHCHRAFAAATGALPRRNQRSGAGSRNPCQRVARPPVRAPTLCPDGARRMKDSRFLERTSGVLLHPTSLPGPHGHGDLGPAAHRFAGFLASAGQSWWQMLPLGPPGAGNSPYDSPSTFAGSAGLVSLEQLAAEGLLEPQEIAPPRALQGKRVRYAEAARYRLPRLQLAHQRFVGSASKADRRAFAAFREQQRSWLGDYALYQALKSAAGGAPWYKWEPDLTARRPAALRHAKRELADRIAFHEFVQFAFDRQWRALARRCRELGIGLLGDVPIYVALDGADVWAHRELFHVDRNGKRRFVAGVPPDAFSSTGQLWGNPLYRWSALDRSNYAWWIARLELTLSRFDAVRLDHFIGFRRYWEVKAGARTAEHGRFVRVPGERFLGAVRDALGGLPFVAEDLGIVTDEVRALRDQFGLPGMRVVQFAFDESGPNDYQPHRYPRRTVAYTGTHDNDTAVGWFRQHAPRGDRKRARELADRRRRVLAYLGSDGREIHWDLIRLVLMSVADTALFPMQDLLGLGSDARMNTPGTTHANWSWRVRQEDLAPRVAERMLELCETYERIPGRRARHGAR